MTASTGKGSGAKGTGPAIGKAEQAWTPEIIKASDLPSQDVTIILMGMVASGKTHAVASLSAEIPTLIINCDQHTEDLRVRWPDASVIEIVPDELTTTKPIITAYSHIMRTIQLLIQGKGALEEGDEPFSAFVIDPLTPIILWARNHAKKMVGKSPFEATSQPDFGNEQLYIGRLLQQFRRLPGIKIVTVHVEKEFEAQPDGRTLPKFLPMVTGKQSASLGDGFGEIWFATTQSTEKGTNFVIQSKTGERFTARTSVGLPDGCDNDLAVNLLPLLRGEKSPGVKSRRG